MLPAALDMFDVANNASITHTSALLLAASVLCVFTPAWMLFELVLSSGHVVSVENPARTQEISASEQQCWLLRPRNMPIEASQLRILFCRQYIVGP